MHPKIFSFFVVLFFSAAVWASDGPSTAVPLPDGKEGVGFDDMVFSPESGKLIVPGGRTGRIFLVDPETRQVDTVPGFSQSAKYDGKHDQGATSADEGDGLLFVVDRADKTLTVVDAGTKDLVSGALLLGNPDYVRYVPSTHEVWVTEPGLEGIECFHLTSGEKRKLVPAARIDVPGGPESLVIDPVRGHAYTHLWKGSTVGLDLATRQVVKTWPNGCEGSRGIALDGKKGFLFAGCAEGKAIVMDVETGKILGSVKTGEEGVDVIGYNPDLSHLYLAGAKSATLSIVGVSAKGEPTLLTEYPTAKGAHCAAADDRGHVWICDPDRGQLLLFTDTTDR